MCWNTGYHKHLSQSKIKIGTLSCFTLNSKNFTKKLTQTEFEMHQLPDVEKTDSKREISCLNWIKYKSRIEVCGKFKTETVSLNIVVYCYRNSSNLKVNEVDLKLTEYQSNLAKRAHLLSYFNIFYMRCIVIDETTVHIQNTFVKKVGFFSNEIFAIVHGIENAI